MESVVITGLGCITSIGQNVEEFSKRLFSDEHTNSFREISLFDTARLTHKVAAEVVEYDETAHFSAAEIKQIDRYSQFALIATDEAVQQSGLDEFRQLDQCVAVIYGTGVGGQSTTERSYQQLLVEGKQRAHPFTVPKLIPSSATSQISMKYGVTGPACATTSACSSSGHAIATAAMMIRSGMIDVAIVGGSEACITEGNFLAWEGLRVLAKDNCRPFSADRAGLIIGEGAGTLILEAESFAKQRNANILARLAGIGMSSDAHNLVQPDVNGAAKAMQACLADANLTQKDVQYINAHGSGTKQNDQTESAAIRQVFGEHADRLLVSSTKSQHGHVLGAGSAIEAIATIQGMKENMVPATRNFSQEDPACDLDYVVNQPRQKIFDTAISNSFAFGGLNVSLAFKKV